jgi:hypothetical protein
MDYFILFSLLTAIFITSFVILKILRSKADYKRTLNLAFLKITLPKKNSDLDEKKETTNGTTFFFIKVYLFKKNS